MGFWVPEIVLFEGNRNQIRKVIHGLLSIKGFYNICAGEAEQDSTRSIRVHTNTHAEHVRCCYELIIYLFSILSVSASPPVEHL